MEHDIPCGNSNRENGTTFLDFPLFLGIFQWDEPTKGVPFTAGPEIPEILTKWKVPKVYSQRKNERLCPSAMANRLAAPTQLLPHISAQYMKSFIVQAGKSSIGSEQDWRSLDTKQCHQKRSRRQRYSVFPSSQRDFDFLNSCLYLSIGDVLCG